MNIIEESTKDTHSFIQSDRQLRGSKVGKEQVDLDSIIENIYNSCKLTNLKQFSTADDMVHNMQILAKTSHIHLYFYDGHSQWNTMRGQVNIFVNNTNSIERQWEDFGFMFSNILLFFKRKTDNVEDFTLTKDSATLAHLICVPTFLMKNIKELHGVSEAFAIEQIKNKFKVTHSFAEKSYALYCQKYTLNYESSH